MIPPPCKSVYLFILEEDYEDDDRGWFNGFEARVTELRLFVYYLLFRNFFLSVQGDENYDSNELFIGFCTTFSNPFFFFQC